MPRPTKPVVILLADDDPDDRHLAREAFADAALGTDLRFVEDGVEVFEYLRHSGRYADPASSPRPSLILLDLNMPRMDGREVLEQLRADPALAPIRVIVMTTSQADEDVKRCYQLSAASYIAKPDSFADLVSVVQALGRYWFDTVELPRHAPAAAPERPAV